MWSEGQLKEGFNRKSISLDIAPRGVRGGLDVEVLNGPNKTDLTSTNFSSDNHLYKLKGDANGIVKDGSK